MPELSSDLDLRLIPNAPLGKLKSLSSVCDSRCREMLDPYLSFLSAVSVVRKIRAVRVFPSDPVR